MITSPGSARCGRMSAPSRSDPDAGGVDEDPVAVAAIDDLRVAGDDGHSGVGGGRCHRLDDHAELSQREAFFQDQSDAEVAGDRAAHGDVVHGAVDGEFPDVPAGEEAWADDERVGGERDRTARVEDGRVGEFRQFAVTERRHEEMLDQLRGELATSAVAHHDRRVISQRHRARPVFDGHGVASSSWNRPYR